MFVFCIYCFILFSVKLMHVSILLLKQTNKPLIFQTFDRCIDRFLTTLNGNNSKMNTFRNKRFIYFKKNIKQINPRYRITFF